MSEEKTVLFETKGRIAFITFNRPEKMNAMNLQVFGELKEAFEKYNDDNDLWCCVFSGKGDNFCTGGDIKWLSDHQQETGGKVLYEDDYYSALRNSPKPIISAIQGYCLGAGMSVGLKYSDIHIASECAKFGCTESRWSIAPPYRAPTSWDIGLANTLYMGLTGVVISGEQALRMGLVSEVVPREKLLERAIELADMVVANAPIDTRAHKEYYRKFMELPGGGGDELAQTVFKKVWDSEDAVEGPLAFAEKRKPVWKNR
ncbi:enoyl-CoA hydratase/isomerase family protein [Pseudomaricurvus alkylphenolicus]|uniref:enoyl-CoA hydratase/isomerase family protein n=1 Tax=Pseudomaricurvus alkylphenolicus TaxID=1306991 RepID=UPI001421213A|nr:enoyl-CoA hydratase/isomerase family protein [Pseudomaricurvus alkylphenolicus]NIB45030.1 enoyl-CoA hydratase/isomerase family protein [Pseudomaricurvus alkylphenolicus]